MLYFVGVLKGRKEKIFQDFPPLPKEFFYADKVQNKIVWNNIIWGWIAHYCTKCKSDYLKEGTSSKKRDKLGELIYRKTPANGKWEVFV